MRFGSIVICMVIDMNESRLKSVAQMGACLEGTFEIKFQRVRNDVERDDFVAAVLERFAYRRLGCVGIKAKIEGDKRPCYAKHSHSMRMGSDCDASWPRLLSVQGGNHGHALYGRRYLHR